MAIKEKKPLSSENLVDQRMAVAKKPAVVATESSYFWLEYVLLGVIILHLAICPWTRVEESFNVQAVHDILFHGTNISQYDHLEFSGPVPRSFIGPLVISALSLLPKILVVDILNDKKVFVLFLARVSHGSIVYISLLEFTCTVRQIFGHQTAKWLLMILISQFHFLFYASRPLPNSIALPLVLFAVSRWLKSDIKGLIFFAAFAGIIFRSELILLFGPMILISLIRKDISFGTFLFTAMKAAPLAVLLTVAVDSIFWKRLLWPEGQVLWFNTIMNQSSKWGTSPFLWYFYSAIPRMTLFSLPFLLYGSVRLTTVRLIIVPFIIFVFLYSFLPHKELRFIIYICPVLDLGAAVGCRFMEANGGVWKFLAKFHLLLNLLATIAFVSVSSKNYTGGDALYRLHQLVNPTTEVHVFLDNFSLQNGISRFHHQHDHWRYNKSESVNLLEPEDLRGFSHIIAEDKYSRAILDAGFHPIEAFYGFGGLNRTIPKLSDVLQRQWSPFVWSKTLNIWVNVKGRF